MSRDRIRCATALAVWLVAAPLAGRAPCSTMTLPLGGTAPKHGLSIHVSSPWVEATGYRPVTFNVTPLTGPAPADRRLTIIFSPEGHYRGRETQQVSFTVEVPQGSKGVSKTVSVPQSDIWHRWSVEVFEEGRRLKDLSGQSAIPRTVQSYSWTEAYPSMLFIDRDAPPPSAQGTMVGQMRTQGLGGESDNQLPNIRQFARFFPPQSNNYQQNLASSTGTTSTPTDGEILVMVRNLSTVSLAPPSALPVAWINYTCYDVILMSLEDLRLTITDHPQVWVALREYISTGGNLMVYGIGPEFERLDELASLISLTDADREQVRANQTFPGWNNPSVGRYGAPMTDLLQSATYYQQYGQYGPSIETEVDAGRVAGTRRNRDKAPKPMFVVRPLGLGQVVAIGPEGPVVEDSDQWDWIFNEIGRDQWQWYRRNGLSRSRRNADFWNFLIPGVGAAPVKMFLAIITAFVIVIGPVNYWFLRKSRRLYLLLVTVPIGAGIITFCLFTYALLSDGLGTRVRLRSYTEIDGSKGASVSWSRQSYYAGMAPSGGLNFPNTTAVYPIDDAPRLENSRKRVTRWGPTQNLAAGYIRSRSLSQLMVVNSAPTQARVLVKESAGNITATNQLGLAVSHLLVFDNDKYYWAEDIDPDEVVQLEPSTREDVLLKIDELKSENRPTLPTGFVQPRISRQFRYYYNNADRQFPNPNLATSVLERKLRTLSTLPPRERRAYFAFTRKAPSSVPVGVERASQEVGFHVVKGTW